MFYGSDTDESRKTCEHSIEVPSRPAQTSQSQSLDCSHQTICESLSIRTSLPTHCFSLGVIETAVFRHSPYEYCTSIGQIFGLQSLGRVPCFTVHTLHCDRIASFHGIVRKLLSLKVSCCDTQILKGRVIVMCRCGSKDQQKGTLELLVSVFG